MRYRTSTPNERVWCITQLAKLSFNHSIGRTHSWRSSIFYKISLSVCLSVCVNVCTCNIRRFHWLRELYEADFHKPGIYGSGRVWANAWDVFRCTPSWDGRDRRAAMDFVACFWWDGFFRVFCYFFVFFFSFERIRPAASMRPPCLIYLSTSNETRPRGRNDRGRFLHLGKKASSYRSEYRVPLFN